ncbi:MAG TPA: NADP-dependent methylenetetrahydromethanopterin/methylenetetrahydrofolate dehydrogenase [Gemmatimonadales bacterium]|nr:NADP-dependent methylenetetrahydromethanopterin/methylenetetrahydrofolate dehydrogenase [Gemmatimonadales bacterium]
MRKLLLQLDSSRLPSVFDRIVAHDAGADDVMSYGGVVEGDVRDLIHGCIFTRGPKDLKHTAVFIGGADMTAGEGLLRAARSTFFGPFSVSLMLDSNGSNTTAVAAVMKLLEVAGELRGTRVAVLAGTGPVGLRAAGLLAKQGAEVLITSRSSESGTRAQQTVSQRFGGAVQARTVAGPDDAARALEGAVVVLNAGPAGVQLLPKRAWAGRAGLRALADVNAVPPQGVEGVEPNDDGVEKDGVRCFGALAIGSFKMKLHRACIARLFERNDLVLDAESIADLARDLGKTRS